MQNHKQAIVDQQGGYPKYWRGIRRHIWHFYDKKWTIPDTVRFISKIIFWKTFDRKPDKTQVFIKKPGFYYFLVACTFHITQTTTGRGTWYRYSPGDLRPGWPLNMLFEHEHRLIWLVWAYLACFLGLRWTYLDPKMWYGLPKYRLGRQT